MKHQSVLLFVFLSYLVYCYLIYMIMNSLSNMVSSLFPVFRSRETPQTIHVLMWAYEKSDMRNMSTAIKEYVNDTLICPGTPCFVTGNRSFLPSHDMFDAIGRSQFPQISSS